MAKSSTLKSKIFTSLGSLFLLIPLFYQFLWIYIFGKLETHSERVEHFRSYLPSIIREPRIATQLFLAFCLMAIIFSLISFRQSSNLLKGVNILVLIVSLLLMLILLFQLM